MRIKSSWDDGAMEDARLAKLLRKYDIDAVFYWPVDFKSCNEASGRISLNPREAQNIADKFEIGSHGVTHALLTRIPIEQARMEITDSKGMIENQYGVKITRFCYPRGYANPDLQQIVKEAGYESARSTVVGRILPGENPYFEETTVHVGYDRREYGGKSWLEYARHMLEEAVQTEGSVYSIFGHSWEISKYDGWHDLETLFKEVKAVR